MASGEDIKKELTPKESAHLKMVQKGLLLHRQKLVYNVKTLDSTISAQVQDVTPVSVKLDLDFPLLSRCSCPETGWCRHRMAVFFTIFQRVNSVSEWVKSWKGEDSVVPEVKKAAELTNLHPALKTASSLLQRDVLRGQTPQNWYDYFQSLLAEVDKESWLQNSFMLDMNVQSLHRKFMKDAPMEREWKPLYQLFVSVFLYETLYEWLAKKEGAIFSKRGTSVFSFILDELYDSVYQMSVTAMPFAFDPFMKFLKERSLKWTSLQDASIEGMDLYRTLWFFLFTKKQWREEEKKRLSAFTQRSEMETVALLHQLLLLDETDTFLTLAKEHSANVFRYSEHWLYYFFQHQAPEKAVSVISSCLPHVSAYLEQIPNDYERSDFSRWYIGLIDASYMARQEPRLYKQLLLTLLPYSYYPLSRFLFDAEDYREWVELQQWLGYEIGEMEYLGLKEIVKQQPELGLPLYHEAVESLLANRNRDSYKQAVRVMKKIRTLYKKQKKIEQWERYLDYILDETKRLRAFHEECRKGKLIHA